MLEKGITGKQKVIVDNTNTAEVYGSGDLPVFATPAMIGLMEFTASKSVAEHLEKGQSTVGTIVNVKHLAATPVGMEVYCESELVDIDRRRLVFNVKAYDECGLIGEGVHERFIIDVEKFMGKTNSKKA
ncbi:MAG: thioesterase family protein [Clostridia bacterium]|nr:thioesterase family protein [Clostridia bacterium]